MKKITILASALALSVSVFGQGELDAYKLSRNDLTGTAASVAMGGAFGAIGGNISGIAINPAGIGFYTQSEVVTTLNFQNTSTKTNYYDSKNSDNKFKASFDNIGFVAAIPIGSDDVPFLNFGFSYNRLKSFDRKLSTRGSALNGSGMADYMAVRAGAYAPNELMFNDIYSPFDKGADWLGALGYSSNLIEEVSGGVGGQRYERHSELWGAKVNNRFDLREKGTVNSYDFNMGTTISDVVSFGLTVAVTDIDYSQYSLYEEVYSNAANQSGDYGLQNWLKTEGTGWQIKAGVIVKPIEELRIGLAYHSPTWYNMTDQYEVNMDYDMSGILSYSNPAFPNSPTSGGAALVDYMDAWGDFDYRYRTPDKWTFSLAGVIAERLILSADYELANYQNMKLYNDRGNALAVADKDPNRFIKRDYKMASTARFGAELVVTPSVSLRAGYAWMQSPLESVYKNNERLVEAVGTIPHYIQEGDKHHITCGAGFKLGEHFYTDIAFVTSSQKDDLYMFPKVEVGSDVLANPDRITMKTNKFQGLLTVGYRF